MREQRHTKEPWIELKAKPDPTNGAYGICDVTGTGSSCLEVCIARAAGGTVQEAHHNAERIVACVNACTGIQNPAALPAAVEALRRLVDAFTTDACISPNMPVQISVETNGVALDKARAALAQLERGEG